MYFNAQQEIFVHIKRSHMQLIKEKVWTKKTSMRPKIRK